MTDADKMDVLAAENRRLRELIDLMRDHGEQTVVYLTLYPGDDGNGVGLILTHADEMREPELVRWIGDKVKEIFDRGATAAERERCVSLMRHRLLFNSQRAVSWHEVADCMKAVRKGESAPESPRPRTEP